MDQTLAKRIIEGALFVSTAPMALRRLKEIVDDLDPQAVRQMIEQLDQDYVQAQRAFRVQEVAGGYQLVTDPELAPWLKRSGARAQKDSLSKPALETLAIIAYRQPITKAEIEAIRGVDGSATLETLLEHQFVRIVGRKDSPGRPLLYGTTDEFLRHMGLKSLKDLPPVKPESREIPGFTEQARPLAPSAQTESAPPPAEPVQSGLESAEPSQEPTAA